MSVRNVVIFGQTGVGKSSVVNLMAGKERAQTSNETVRCTLHWTEYPISFDGYNYQVFDTVGMEDRQLGMKEYLSAIENAYHLITRLRDQGGIHLLIFCVRSGRFTSTIQNNYRLFYECFCEKKVPILVITGLEGETNMDNWWIRSKRIFDQHEVIVDGHACITAVNGPDKRQQHLYKESRRLVCDLVIKHCKVGCGYNGDEGDDECTEDNKHKGENRWFRRVMTKLKVLLLSSSDPKKKDITTVLTKRCGVPREAAVLLAKQIKGA